MPNVPKAIGPYSAYQRIGNIIYTSGQLPLDPNTGSIVEGDITRQTLQSLENIKNILALEGSDLTKVAKFTVFMTDLSAFDQVNEAFKQVLSEPYPARTAIQISKLPLGAPLEIEAIAEA